VIATVLARADGFAARIATRSARLASLLRGTLFWLQLTGKLRRLMLTHLRPDYVRAQLARREGECLRCGACCALLYTCPALADGRECLAYGRWRPRSCHAFPIDERDLREVEALGGRCGYRFPATVGEPGVVRSRLTDLSPRGCEGRRPEDRRTIYVAPPKRPR